MLQILLAVILLGLLLLLDIRNRILKYDLPPGPRGIPFLGNVLQIRSQPYLKLSQWAKEFGKLYTINLVHKPMLVLNDQKLMKELFGMMVATGKLSTDVMLLVTEGSYGIANSEGPIWVEQKHFCMRTLKKYGFARGSHMEPLILREVEDLCNWIENEQNCGRNILLNDKMKQVATNIIWSMVSGERIISHESKIVHLLDKFLQDVQKVTRTGVLFFSWIKYLAPVRSGYQSFKSYAADICNYVESCFEKHKNTRVDNDTPRDIIDEFIDKVKDCEDSNSSFYGEIGRKHSVGSTTTFLVVGGETTGSTLTWMIFYLCMHHKVQEKFHKEIHRVIGENRNPTSEDKLNMPYTEAIILETIRVSSFTPFGVIHQLLEDTKFQGYRLPKGLLLLQNLYHVHYDKTIWGDPEVFRPDRFLEGGIKLKENIVAFQPGKRSCPGEAVAKDIIFLFATTLFQKYSFYTDPQIKDKSEYLVPSTGYFLLPQKLPVAVTKRL